MTEQQLKNTIVSELETVVNMSTEEYTLFDKWREFDRVYDNNSYDGSNFFGETDAHPIISQYKNRLWVQNDPMDYLHLKPKLIRVDNDKETIAVADDYIKPSGITLKDYDILVKFISSFNTQGSVGRSLKYVVIDETSNKYLGVINIASDIQALTVRDSKIGWTADDRNKGKLNNTAQGHAFLPTQPFGYNYTGGKLLALFGISDVVENDWLNSFGNKLVGMTTTALYKRPSQYTGLLCWKDFGYSVSNVEFNITKDTRSMVKQFIHDYYKQDYYRIYEKYKVEGDTSGAKRVKSNATNFIYKLLDINKKNYITKFNRGIYFAPFYENSYEFLRNEIKENELKGHINNSTEFLVQTWKDKYATKRIQSLIERNAVSIKIEFYDDLLTLSWEEAKEKYLKDVGR